MSKKKLIGTNRTIFLLAIAAIFLSSLLWDIIEAYIAGGDEAPSTLLLVLAIVVLGGGVIFSAIQTYRTWKAQNEEEQKKAEEARKKAELEQQTETFPEAEE